MACRRCNPCQPGPCRHHTKSKTVGDHCSSDDLAVPCSHRVDSQVKLERSTACVIESVSHMKCFPCPVHLVPVLLEVFGQGCPERSRTWRIGLATLGRVWRVNLVGMNSGLVGGAMDTEVVNEIPYARLVGSSTAAAQRTRSTSGRSRNKSRHEKRRRTSETNSSMVSILAAERMRAGKRAQSP